MPQGLKIQLGLSQLQDFVKKLPNGTETIVGERGAMLSGGQIQRIELQEQFTINQKF